VLPANREEVRHLPKEQYGGEGRAQAAHKSPAAALPSSGGNAPEIAPISVAQCVRRLRGV
jgi:hypothetical protein